MPANGISPAGFAIPTLQAILLNYQQAVLTNISAALDLSDTQPEGQLLTIMSNFDSALWELMQGVYNQFNPEDAEGASLDNIGDLRGVPRNGPTFTQVVCTLTLDSAHAPYVAGSLLANVAGLPSQSFSNLADVTSALITAGTLISGTIYSVPGILFQAAAVGPTPTVNPGTLTAISTPVTGWTAITNPLSQSELGQAEENDDDYLIRQNEEIGIVGSCTPPAIVAQLYAALAEAYGAASVTGAYSVAFYENTSLGTLTFGSLVLPGKSFSVVIFDPAALLSVADIALTVWENKPAGIVPIGAQSGVVNDKYLGLQTVKWNIPVPETLYITATVALYPGQVWANVAPTILAALVAASIAPTPASGLPPVGQLKPGAPVIGSQLKAVISNVPGVADAEAPAGPGGAATRITFDFHRGPTNTAPLAVDPLSVAQILNDPTKIVLVQGVYP